MGIWPKRTEIVDMPARISVSASLLQDDYDWLSDEAHRIGVSMSRIVADIISDYRVSLASADAHRLTMEIDPVSGYSKRVQDMVDGRVPIQLADEAKRIINEQDMRIMTDEDELRDFERKIEEEGI